MGRVLALGVSAVGVALIVVNVSFRDGFAVTRPAWAAVGALLIVLAARPLLRRRSGLAAQDRLIADMWAALRGRPHGWHATDPVTGRVVAIDRTRSRVTLIVRDGAAREPAGEQAGTMTLYLLGLLGTRRPAPLLRELQPLRQEPEPITWRRLRQANAAARRAGTTATASPDELAALHAQVMRTAGPPGSR
ncbi:hypothetical protein [Nonomuraea sp. NPDC050783]|uniref:hypothetical protein n=1 Tax=Nonomuraea sp. NPDC050783 TaxID=3154634 RepID=UPI003467BFA6